MEIDFSHPAHLIVGDVDQAAAELMKLLGPEALVERFATFGLEESRLLKERQSRKVAPGKRQCFILAIDFLTREAQNALLKTLEEPNPGNYFFLLLRSRATLLPTLLSRLRLVDYNKQAGKRDSGAVKDFLRRPPADRLALVNRLLQNGEEEILNFLNELEGLLAQEPKKNLFFLQEISRARHYFQARFASPRLLLEHLALLA